MPSSFIKNIEDRQDYKIGCIEEIALNNKWINKHNIKNDKFNRKFKLLKISCRTD